MEESIDDKGAYYRSYPKDTIYAARDQEIKLECTIHKSDIVKNIIRHYLFCNKVWLEKIQPKIIDLDGNLRTMKLSFFRREYKRLVGKKLTCSCRFLAYEDSEKRTRVISSPSFVIEEACKYNNDSTIFF